MTTTTPTAEDLAFLAAAEDPNANGAAPAPSDTTPPETPDAEPAPGSHDLASAERIAAEHGPVLKHLPGTGWLTSDGKRFVPGDDAAHRAAKQAAKTDLLDAARDGDAKRIKAATARCAEPRIRAALALAATDLRVSITAEQLDADPHLLNTHNGVADLRDGALSEHNATLYLTKLAGAPYLPDAHSARWDYFLDRLTNGDAELRGYLQRAAGYTASGSTAEEIALFAQGPGASGKTTFVEALRAALGDYAKVADFATFLAGRGDGDGPTPGVARLMGARMVCASEVNPGQRFNPARLKALTGGETVVARHLHRAPFEFRPAFTLWLAANDRPAIPASDDAAWRRLRLLPFENVIPPGERDPTLKQQLTTSPNERAAVLAWIVQGAIDWHHHGLGTCTAVQNATGGYQAENDPVADWLTTRCQLHPKAQATGSELRRDYEQWCKRSGEEPCNPHDFSNALKAHGLHSKRGKNGIVWTGVRVYPVQPVKDQTGTSHMRARTEKFPQGPTPGTPGTPREAQA